MRVYIIMYVMYARTRHVPRGGGGDARGARGLGIVEALCADGELEAVTSGDCWVRHVVIFVAVETVVRTHEGLQGGGIGLGLS